MRPLWLLITAFAVTKAYDTALFEDWPPCTANCMYQQLPTTNCSDTDVTCICAHPLLIQDAFVCMGQACSDVDLLTAKQYAQEACDAQSSKESESLVIIVATMCAIAFVMVVIRLVSRQMGSRNLTGGWDDVLVVISWVLALPLVILAGYLSDLGVGKDIWEFPPDKLDDLFLLIYVEAIIYVFAAGFVKIAVLVFYLRIFPSQNFQRVAWIMIAVCGASTLSFTIVCALECQPITYSWQQNAGDAVGTCVNIRAVAFSHAAVNIFLDLVIMIMPMPTLYKLHINWAKKLQIMIMFSFGLIIIVVCILRLRDFVRHFDTDNPTSDFLPLSIWDSAEVYTSIVCVCLPAAKVFFHRSFTWLMAALAKRRRKEVRHLHRLSWWERDPPVSETRPKQQIVKTTSTSVSTMHSGTHVCDWATNITGDEKHCSHASHTVETSGKVPRDEKHPFARDLHAEQIV